MRPLRLMFALLLLLLTACGTQTAPTEPSGELAARPTVATAPTEVPATEAPADQPTTIPTEAVIPTEAAAPTEAPVPTEAAAPAAVLPAPLYFLAPVGEVNQIFRLATDGATQTQITDEAAGVTEYDVSPADGGLAYVSANDLIVADRDGGGRTVLVDGPAVDPNDVNDAHANAISFPVWSPDGARIAYGMGGVYIVAAGGGAAGLIQPNEIQTDANMAAIYKFRIVRYPVSWTPDGAKLLTTFGYVPEGGGYTVFDLASTSAITLTHDEGFLCCNPTWSLSGATIYFASNVVGMTSAGMWAADAATGQTTRLFGTPDGAAPWSLIAHPLPVGNDAFLAFYQETADESVANDFSRQQLVMTQINADGTTAPLRAEGGAVGETLWAPDGSGAVVGELGFQPSALSWLPSDGGPAINLQSFGTRLRWGQ